MGAVVAPSRCLCCRHLAVAVAASTAHHHHRREVTEAKVTAGRPASRYAAVVVDSECASPASRAAVWHGWAS